MKQLNTTVNQTNLEHKPADLAVPTIGLIGIIVIVVGMAAASIYLAPTTTTTFLAMLAVGAPALWLVWTRPEFGLLALIFLAGSYIPPNTIDIRLPVGGLDMRDMLLLLMVGFLLAKGLTKGRVVLPWWPVSGLLLVYFAVAVFSALYALLYQGVSATWALSELRAVLYIAIFFVTAWTIATPRQFSIVVTGLFLIADLTATIVVLQQFLGKDNRLLAAMLGNGWYLRMVGDTASDFGDVRVVPPNIVLMFMMMVIAFAILVYPRVPRWQRIFCAFQLAYLGAATLFTYTRALWIASAVALGLVTLILPFTEKARLIRYAVGVVLVVGALLSLFGDELQQAIGNKDFVSNLAVRALSIFTPEETLNTSSLEWRIFENGEALKSISLHPLIGVGLGNAYRDITLLSYEDRRFYFRKTRFVHNSYLYIAVKMGLIGLGAFLLFCAAFLLNGWSAYRRMHESQMKRIALAILASFVGLLLWSNTQMHFLSVESTSVVGLMVGLVASICYMTGTDRAVKRTMELQET